MKAIYLFLLTGFLFSLLSCSYLFNVPFLDQKPTATPEKPFYTISGTLHPARETTIPRNTRVLVLWTFLSDEAEYVYIFGEGTLDFVNYAFMINFDGPPPAEVMNQLDQLRFGYGRVILTANQEVKGKLDETSFAKEEIIGIAASDMIFYIDGNVDAIPNASWLSSFSQGYSVAREVKMSSGPDEFRPASPNSLQIIIDDLDNIDIANWW